MRPSRLCWAPSPGGILTTNIVGGLGNQLFLLANLLATGQRHRNAHQQQQHRLSARRDECGGDRQSSRSVQQEIEHDNGGIEVALPRVSFSSSCGPPRPVYWDTLFRDLVAVAGVKMYADETEMMAALRQRGDVERVVVPESRPPRRIVLSDHIPSSMLSYKTPTGSILYVLTGFFQSEQYFSDATGAAVLRHAIPAEFWAAARRAVETYYADPAANGGPIRAADSSLFDVHTIGVHVRRGDYLTMRDVFEELDYLEYYDKALQLLAGPALFRETLRLSHYASTMKDVWFPKPPLAKRIRVLLFCEDQRFANRMRGAWQVKYPGVDVAVVSEARESAILSATQPPSQSGSSLIPRDALELLMMACCDDVIMANSTFSWWGAYWNSTPGGRVVAPSRWFVKDPFPTMQHLYCDHWIVL